MRGGLGPPQRAQGVQGGIGPPRPLAPHHREGQALPHQQLAQTRVHRLAHMGAVPLQPIGLPGQIQCSEQRDVAMPLLPGQGLCIQRAAAEDLVVVDGGHQRRRVGQHQGMRAGRGLDASGLLGGDLGLLVFTRRAAGSITPFTQHLRHPGAAPAGQCRQHLGQGAGQCALAGALGPDDGDDAAGLSHAPVPPGPASAASPRRPAPQTGRRAAR